jgi:hypothetical protein
MVHVWVGPLYQARETHDETWIVMAGRRQTVNGHSAALHLREVHSAVQQRYVYIMTRTSLRRGDERQLPLCSAASEVGDVV